MHCGERNALWQVDYPPPGLQGIIWTAEVTSLAEVWAKEFHVKAETF